MHIMFHEHPEPPMVLKYKKYSYFPPEVNMADDALTVDKGRTARPSLHPRREEVTIVPRITIKALLLQPPVQDFKDPDIRSRPSGLFARPF